ncbi:alpha-E domain-containing protein [Altererythrobacter aquiaggeris]|uniref:alpha-E domain-containing protein n=1 Tax=Aestuarierythrobacter aquiaggeris TaxID=1898396 RepID=UPI00301A4C93
MLGRTAHGIYWMFRYLERAENTVRLLDAGFRMALTRDLVTSEEEWRSVIQTAGLKADYEKSNVSYSGIQVWNFILRDKANPLSVMDMIDNVRTNARLARNAISEELWEGLNESWMGIKQLFSKPISQRNLGDALAMVRNTGTLVQGSLEGTMLRDEGYAFARAGTFVERADNTARILDIKYYLLLPSLAHVGSSLDTGQWDNVLRSVSGNRAFRSIHAARIDSRGIMEFLVLDDRFPRSLAFCFSELRANLAELARLHGTEGDSNALMREADQQLSNTSIEDILDTGLHHFLTSYIVQNRAIAAAISNDYRFVS